MSQENVEIAKTAFEVWNKGDMEAYRELFDPNAIMRPMENWPEPGPFVGVDAVMRQFQQLRETYDANDTSQQFGLVNPQRQDTPNDPDYDQAEPDGNPRETTNLFDERALADPGMAAPW